MIILASDDPVQVEALGTQLRQKGYLYSIAENAAGALDAARSDRVNLFLIDTGCASFDGFELCRTIKSDEALAGMPVLILISLTDTGRLLAVLDCTADAFVSKPCDPQTLWSAVSDLQAMEGKKPATREVMTRFIVTHEGRGYSVVADRRELLGFLLSTFELAVRIRNEAEQMKSGLQREIRGLNDRLCTLAAERDGTVRNLHDELEERSRVISQLKTAIQTKDQEGALLRIQSDNLLQELKEKAGSFEEFQYLAEEKNGRLAAVEGQLFTGQEALKQAQDRIRTLFADLTSAASARDAEIQAKKELEGNVQALREQIDALTRERDGLLQSARDATARYTQLQTDPEAELAALREKYANVQQFLDSASRDIGVLNAALAEEKEKRRAVEERLKAAIRESETKKRAIAALSEERAAPGSEHKDENAPVVTNTTPTSAPRSDTPTLENGVKKPIDIPPHVQIIDRKQGKPELFPPAPPSVQARLPELVPAIALSEAAEPEKGVQVTEPEQPNVVHNSHAIDSTASQSPEPAPTARMPPDLVVSRGRWFDMIKWVHHTETIPSDQRKELLRDLVRMSRLVQKGRHLTSRQDAEMRALFTRMQALGYRFH
jgi:CheY-like chemotaxis protein